MGKTKNIASIALASVTGVVALGASASAQANFCPAVYQPVCADDGVRYSNSCQANNAGATPLDGGALIEMVDAHGVHFAFWSTNDAFIDEAIDIRDGVLPQRIPNFRDLHWGGECSDPHTFHPDPEDMGWADMTMEVCDGHLGYINENINDWMDQVDQWCPWMSYITEVWDYRS